MFTHRVWVSRDCCCLRHAAAFIEMVVEAEVVWIEWEQALDTAEAFAFTAWCEPFPHIVPRLRDRES